MKINLLFPEGNDEKLYRCPQCRCLDHHRKDTMVWGMFIFALNQCTCCDTVYWYSLNNIQLYEGPLVILQNFGQHKYDFYPHNYHEVISTNIISKNSEGVDFAKLYGTNDYKYIWNTLSVNENDTYQLIFALHSESFYRLASKLLIIVDEKYKFLIPEYYTNIFTLKFFGHNYLGGAVKELSKLFNLLKNEKKEIGIPYFTLEDKLYFKYYSFVDKPKKVALFLSDKHAFYLPRWTSFLPENIVKTLCVKFFINRFISKIMDCFSEKNIDCHLFKDSNTLPFDSNFKVEEIDYLNRAKINAVTSSYETVIVPSSLFVKGIGVNSPKKILVTESFQHINFLNNIGFFRQNGTYLLKRLTPKILKRVLMSL